MIPNTVNKIHLFISTQFGKLILWVANSGDMCLYEVIGRRPANDITNLGDPKTIKENTQNSSHLISSGIVVLYYVYTIYYNDIT